MGGKLIKAGLRQMRPCHNDEVITHKLPVLKCNLASRRDWEQSLESPRSFSLYLSLSLLYTHSLSHSHFAVSQATQFCVMATSQPSVYFPPIWNVRSEKAKTPSFPFCSSRRHPLSGWLWWDQQRPGGQGSYSTNMVPIFWGPSLWVKRQWEGHLVVEQVPQKVAPLMWIREKQ